MKAFEDERPFEFCPAEVMRIVPAPMDFSSGPVFTCRSVI